MDQTNNQINQMQKKVLCLFYIVNCFILTRICSKSKSMARSQFDHRLCAALVQSKSLGRPPHQWPWDVNKVKIQHTKYKIATPPHQWPCDVNKVKTQNMSIEKVETLAFLSLDVMQSQNVSIYDRDVSHLSRHCLLLAWVSPFLQGLAEHLRKRSVGNHHRRLHVHCTIDGKYRASKKKVAERMLLKPQFTNSITNSYWQFQPELVEFVTGNCFRWLLTSLCSSNIQ